MPDRRGMGGQATRVAVRDGSLGAMVITRKPLLYGDGADAALDRPAHVRAASSLATVGDALVVVQDDANFLGVLRPRSETAFAVTLPSGREGLRQFDDLRGNKRFKLDLESSIATVTAGEPTLYAFGSGSSPAREHVVIARGWDTGAITVEMIEAPSLYGALRGASDFAGSELNLEGVALRGDDLWCFGRGNGAARGDAMPLNATCVLPWSAVLECFAAGGSGPLPAPTNIARYALGSLDGIPFGFTDAVAIRGGFLYSAAAEDSPDAVRDGPVAGSALGIIQSGGDVRWALLTDADGRQFTGKVEGIAWDLHSRDVVMAVIDHDDPRVPSELCSIRLEGRWA